MSISPTSGRIGELVNIIEVNMDNRQGIYHRDIQSRQSELIAIRYGDRYLLLNILQEVTQYPDGLITSGQAIIVSKIGIDGHELDLIVAGELQYSCGYIKAQLGSVYDARKEQQLIPVDLDLKV
jgi:hypothetical protein